MLAPNQPFEVPKPRSRADSDALALSSRQALSAEERKSGVKNRSANDHDSNERPSRRQRTTTLQRVPPSRARTRKLARRRAR